MAPYVWLLIAAFFSLLSFGLSAKAIFSPGPKWQFGLRAMLVVTTLTAVVSILLPQTETAEAKT